MKSVGVIFQRINFTKIFLVQVLPKELNRCHMRQKHNCIGVLNLVYRKL